MKDLNKELLSGCKLFKRENDIIQWGIDRNIIGNNAQATFEGQKEKTRQEWQEWRENHSQDDIGDIFVTLVMGLALKGTTLSQCVKYYYPDGKELGWNYYTFPLTGRSIWLNYFLNRAVVGYLEEDCYEVNSADIIHCLSLLCEDNGWTLEECIEVAWNDIKDRKGKMIHGMFIKQHDLDSLKVLGITCENSNNFSGTLYFNEDLIEVSEILSKLSLNFTSEGSLAEGLALNTTGRI